jgi:ketosteroid isomerase-like protein
MAHKNEALIHRFYAGFSQRNAEAMISCYHKDVVFHDPVFSTLKYADTCGMWRMLCERGKDLKVALVKADADESGGEAEWVAEYTFSATGRPVINQVHSKFTFRDGLIISQNDNFDLWKWTRMALGAKGVLLGWTPLVKNALQKNVKQALAAYKGA